MASFKSVAGLVGVGLYALLVRPRLLRWGATEDEVKGPFPGQDLVPGGKRGATMAVTLDAPPSEVWKWLAQMGCDRAGWYSWDRLDNQGRHSARRLHSEWQGLSLGQHLASTPNGKAWFEVAGLEPERFLGLRATFTPAGRAYEARGPRPKNFVDSLWAFQLKPLPGGRTRLVVSGYSAAHPKWFGALTGFVFWEPAHWLMQTRQFVNLQRRVRGELAPSGTAVMAKPIQEAAPGPRA